jgi:hypothetical protein
VATPTKSSDTDAFWCDDFMTEEVAQMLAFWGDGPTPAPRPASPPPLFDQFYEPEPSSGFGISLNNCP